MESLYLWSIRRLISLSRFPRNRLVLSAPVPPERKRKTKWTLQSVAGAVCDFPDGASAWKKQTRTNLRRSDRERYPNRGAFGRTRAKGKFSVMSLDDAMHDRQTQTGSSPLGGLQQRTERASLLLIIHAVTGIFEFDDH